MQDGADSQPQPQTPTRRGLISFQVRRNILVALSVVTTAVILAVLFLKGSAPEVVVYKGKTLEAWFYGSRRDFFGDRTRKPAQEAIDGLGTNAFPFLSNTLKHPKGSSGIYFKLYRAMPNQVQAKLPIPF